jgi:hypothetical protein
LLPVVFFFSAVWLAIRFFPSGTPVRGLKVAGMIVGLTALYVLVVGGISNYLGYQVAKLLQMLLVVSILIWGWVADTDRQKAELAGQGSTEEPGAKSSRREDR